MLEAIRKTVLAVGIAALMLGMCAMDSADLRFPLRMMAAGALTIFATTDVLWYVVDGIKDALR